MVGIMKAAPPQRSSGPNAQNLRLSPHAATGTLQMLFTLDCLGGSSVIMRVLLTGGWGSKRSREDGTGRETQGHCPGMWAPLEARKAREADSPRSPQGKPIFRLHPQTCSRIRVLCLWELVRAATGNCYRVHRRGSADDSWAEFL